MNIFPIITIMSTDEPPTLTAEEIEVQKKNYVMARDLQGAQRLNWQHGVLQTLNDNELMHRSIDVSTLVQKPGTNTTKPKRFSGIFSGSSKKPAGPKGTTLRIAEVASGTGLFAAQLKKQLADDGYTDVEIDAFDLVHNHSVPELVDNTINYKIHNMVKPWPEEFHNKYDYVHVRFIGGSLQKEEWEPSVKNCIDILRPGGYLQWEELATRELGSTNETEASRLILEGFYGVFINSGKDGYGPATLERLFKENDLQGIEISPIDTRLKPEFTTDVDEIFVRSTIEMAEAMIKNGAEFHQNIPTMEEFQKVSTILREELREDKTHFFFVLVTIIGRKPLVPVPNAHTKKDSCVIC